MQINIKTCLNMLTINRILAHEQGRDVHMFQNLKAIFLKPLIVDVTKRSRRYSPTSDTFGSCFKSTLCR